MELDVFLFKKYKDYLNRRLDQSGRGSRARLATSIGCQTAYIAQVLRGQAHFSLEQAETINEFLSHTYEEGTFFLLLVQYERAGTPALRKRLQIQMDDILGHRRQLKNRLEVKPVLDLQAQSQYYSKWYYSAIHALISVPGFQSPESIASRLRMSPKAVAEAINFLLSINILTRNPKNNKIEIGTTRIHLGHESPLINKHHMNWRIQTMNVLEKDENDGLHYSSAISLSNSDAEKIREFLTSTIQQTKKIIKDSKEETTMAFCIDFFRF